MSKTTERFSLYGDERKELTEAEEAYRLHSTAMNPDYRVQPVVGQKRKKKETTNEQPNNETDERMSAIRSRRHVSGDAHCSRPSVFGLSWGSLVVRG